MILHRHIPLHRHLKVNQVQQILENTNVHGNKHVSEKCLLWRYGTRSLTYECTLQPKLIKPSGQDKLKMYLKYQKEDPTLM